MNSVSIGSNDLGTPDNAGKADMSSGSLERVDPTKNPVEYVSTGGPADTNEDSKEAMVSKGNSKGPSSKENSAMNAAMLRRLTQFFCR